MDPSFDIAAARRRYRNRLAARKTKRRKLWHQANQEADAAVNHIITEYHPSRVIQWGSVVKPELFTEVSDIDIAVEGIKDPETWSRMERELADMVSFPLDLVPFEKLRREHQDSILLRGRVVYERD